MAEKNYRQYGWPIPQHLQASVAAIAPDLQHTFTSRTSARAPAGTGNPLDKEHSERLAAGRGKLQEVDLGPEAKTRIEQAWKRLEKGEPEQPAGKVPQNKYGYAWRKPRGGGKTDEDKKRDQMVEAVLSEAKRMSPTMFLSMYSFIPTNHFTPQQSTTSMLPPHPSPSPQPPPMETPTTRSSSNSAPSISSPWKQDASTTQPVNQQRQQQRVRRHRFQDPRWEAVRAQEPGCTSYSRKNWRRRRGERWGTCVR